MIKQFFFLLLFLSTFQSFSQKLVYKSNGTILNSENQKISPDQVRDLLKDNEKLLADYNAGRSKKTAGNVLLIGGLGLLAADLISGLTTDNTTVASGNYYSIQGVQSERNYPTVLTYIGVAAIVIAIPIKIGFSKKIKNVVTEYNNLTTVGYNQFNKQKLDLITNSKGIGFRLTLN
jgi:hypothetical protein